MYRFANLTLGLVEQKATAPGHEFEMALATR
jgi:hypothetical protein